MRSATARPIGSHTARRGFLNRPNMNATRSVTIQAILSQNRSCNPRQACMKRKDAYKTFVFKERAQKVKYFLAPLSIEPEVDLDVNGHGNRLPKPHRGLESIRLHCLDSFLTQAHSQVSPHLPSLRFSLRINNKSNNADPLVLRLPCLLG